MLNQFFDFKPEVLTLDQQAMELCQPYFRHAEEIRDYNQLKMLRAFADTQMSSTDMLGTTGYGLWDSGRAKLEQIFAQVMGCEDALVRSQFMSGTHTLAVALFGLLRTGDTLLAATGRPYDTLEGVIGLDGKGKGTGTLMDYGVLYDEAPLLPDMTPDYALIARKAPGAKVCHIQRSRGYLQRNAFDLDTIQKIADTARGANPDIIIFVDNCYGEFTQMKEPCQAGADLVVGSLINTLLMQDYPPELYDIWVVPNQCTDHTALAARRFGAHVLECTVPVKSKGEVLRFAWERLAHRGYDAVCVFDADNLADPQFLREMNNAYRAGARVAQGFRDSKNPYDSVVSGCYSIYYWMMDRLHNGGRAGLGLPAMINGTGFMVAASVLERMGGWRTETISEDLELSVQCALEEVQVFWVPKAVTYDEQPLTFRESVKQRRRWTSGTLQVAGSYLPAVGRALVARPSGAAWDVGATLLIPAYQMAALVNLAVSALAAGQMGPDGFSPLLCAAGAAGSLAIAALGATLLAALVLTVEGKWDRRLGAALACYWLFLLSWIPITIHCMFQKTTVWEEIRHTRNLTAVPGCGKAPAL